MRWNGERGDVVSRWLIQVAVIMAIIAVVGYETVAIVVTHVSLDEDGRQVAAAARTTYRDTREIDLAVEAGFSAAATEGIEVIEVRVDEDEGRLTFDLERQATTLLLHRVAFLRDWAVAEVSRSVPLDP